MTTTTKSIAQCTFIILFVSLSWTVTAGDESPLYPIPQHLSPEAKDMLARLGPKEEFVSFEHVRAQFERGMRRRLGALRRSGVEFSQEEVDANGVTAYWLRSPETHDQERVLIFLHGGGYFAGDAKLMVGLPLLIANHARIPVLAVQYGLAPEEPWPVALNESLAAYQWVLDEGYKPKHVGLMGASAGGGLVLSLANAINMRSLPLPGAMFVMSPWTDLTLGGETMVSLADVDPGLDAATMPGLANAYYGGNDPLDPTISPLFGDLAGLPPVLIQVGSKEVLLSDSYRWAQKARRQGVDVNLDIWDGMWHVFQKHMELPEARQAAKEAATFLRSHLTITHTQPKSTK